MATAREQGFTLIELLIVVAIIGIIASFAIPGLLQAKAQANEASAIVSLKATGVAQVSYSTSCGYGGYATSYPVLGTSPTSDSPPFISPDLGLEATPKKSGYTFAMTAGASNVGPNDCLARPTNTGYFATGVPLTFGSTGSRSFSTNAGQAIWQSSTATPPPEPMAVTATTMPIR